MIQVKDNQSGEVQNLEDDKNLPELVSSGSVSIPNQEYEFESPEGEKYKIPAAGFLDAVKQGWKYRDQGILKEEKLKEQYGDSVGKAMLYGGLRGLSLGISDYALKETGLADQEELSAIKQFNPISSTLGEVAGTVAPAFLTSGGSLAAKGAVAGAQVAEKTLAQKIASKTLSGLVNEGSEAVGRMAAQNVKSNVAKKALEMGTAGALEGALVGAGQTVSESALGDHEFNAESLLSNVGTGALLGGLAGSGIGAGVEYGKRAVKGGMNQARKIMIESSNLPAAEKAAMKASIESGEEVGKIATTVFDNPEFKAMAAKNGWPTTPGMENNLGLFQTLESSIAEGASAPAVAVQKNIDKVYDTIDQELTTVVGKGDDVTPLMAGDEVKHVMTQDIQSKIMPHREFNNQLFEEMGNAPINANIQKRAINRLEKSPSFRLASNPRAKYVIDLIEGSKTLNDIEFARKEVGKIMNGIAKSGQDIELESFMNDAYHTLKRAKKDAVVSNALELGPKRGLVMAKKLTKAMDESDKAYSSFYKDYKDVGEALGIKVRSADFFMDKLEETASEQIGSKLIDMNDFRFMEKLYRQHPGIYDTARKAYLGKLAKSVTDATTGDISPVRFAKKVRSMTPEQRKIAFGFDGKANARIDDLLKYIEKAPKKLGKSDTATVQFFQKILSPVYQGTEYARYLLYRGGDAAIKKHLLNDVPVFKAIEQSANKAKGKISSSVNGFLKGTGGGVAMGTISQMDDKDIEKARKSYELVQENPETLIDKFTKSNKNLFDAAPETANALQQRVIAGVQFLQSKVPHKDQEYIGEKIEPSRSELIKFSNYVEAVERPQVIFDQLKQGYMNPNTLEAIRTVYPKMYANIQAEFNAKMPKTLTRAQKIQLQPILGAKVTPAMDYANLMRLQGKTPGSAQAEAQANAQMNHVPVTGAKNLSSSSRSQSGLDKSINRA